ncbi:cysteine hydrolase family protein [Geotalea uraniireducens]|uniref:Isochorismatase hydrolase n=1 Tax=Geotalea uraniireducens (strain Rf4) TaxID=351605 RepID=A5GDG2_GEOUR|nr:isochorismatase family cysteine hydrolase [Geotalea uraniireducens]ABQ24384.1 isochorismatase hydrolase [Geotalea uraniireducens Rf4]
MTFLNVVLTALALFAVLMLLFGLFVMRNMFIPTKGKRIEAYPHPTKALLVMDIQESGGGSNRQSIPLSTSTPLGAMIAASNRVIDWFDQAGMEVAYIRQVFGNDLITRLHGGRILAGRLEPRIDRRIMIINNNDFKKNRTDAFSNPKLEQFLIARQVDEVFLVGLDAAFCVYYTALGALNRGYKVTVIQDAVLTGRDMAKVLERYRQNGIRIINSRELTELPS